MYQTEAISGLAQRACAPSTASVAVAIVAAAESILRLLMLSFVDHGEVRAVFDRPMAPVRSGAATRYCVTDFIRYR